MRTIIGSLGIALALCACGDRNVALTPAVVCPALSVDEPLVYPANGSTGVPVTQHLVIVANFLDNTVYLEPKSGPILSSTTVVPLPNPLPTPNTPAPNLSLTAFAIPALAASTTYTVVSEKPSACPTVSGGSFTTR